MWAMNTFRTGQSSLQKPPLPTTFRSIAILHEYDCTEQRLRVLQGTAYEGDKGQGRIAFTVNRPGDFEYVTPGTQDEQRWNIACSKKP